MTDKELKIQYKVYDENMDRKVRTVSILTSIQANIGNDLIIISKKYKSQLKNKIYLEKIINLLEKENLL